MAELIIRAQGEEQRETVHDQEIGNFILKYLNQNNDRMLKDVSWEIFYQMSSMRESLLNWYPFSEKCEIMELSDGFGGLTGLLSQRAQNVTVIEPSIYRAKCIKKRYEKCNNLTVIAGDLKTLSLNRIFDYIIVEKTINTENDLKKMIQRTCHFLKEAGRLLFVCENRIGMRYWCGVPDPFSNRPFSGIRGLGDNVMMTRKELIDFLEKNKIISGWSLYYPFPDHRLPQAIYSDNYLPKTSIRDRVISYYLPQEKRGLVCLEDEISDELIVNNIFHVLANSFIVECSRKKFMPEVFFAALSTDRGKQHGFATIITSHDTVKKQILYPEGKESLEQMHRNYLEIIKHGVNCIKQINLGNAIEMEYIKQKTLIEHIKYLFLNQKNEVEVIFDQLYEVIKQSSDHVDFAECLLKDNCLNKKNAGIILRKAYIDMIPYNCFYINNDFYFYDQEFVKEFYPAKYILFRALRYTYIYVLQADDILPLQYFKERYGLEEVWQLFEREEAKFVESNRNYAHLSSFYQWTGTTANEINENIDRLMGGGEREEKKKNVAFWKRNCYDLEIYKHNTQMNTAKKAKVEILKRFIEVCEAYELSYCVFYRTLLGTVRHKGYIPWDDNVDIVMLRQDYSRLQSIAPDIFRGPYFLRVLEKGNFFYGGYAKLFFMGEDCNQGSYNDGGFWINIFPLDYALKDKELKIDQHNQIKFYQRLLYKKAYPNKWVLNDISHQEEEHYLQMSSNYSEDYLLEGLYNVIAKYDGEYTNRLTNLSRYYGANDYKEYNEDDFSILVKANFEDVDVYIPVGYENCLVTDYGENYAIYPDEKGRKLYY